MKSFFGIILVLGFLFVIYTENTSKFTSFNEYTDAELAADAKAYNEQQKKDEEKAKNQNNSRNNKGINHPTSEVMDRLPGPKIGSIAPAFSLESVEGKEVKLTDLVGKTVILNFWATWCPPCKEEMPELQSFYEKNKDEVEILAINLDPDADIKSFLKDFGVTFPVLLDDKEIVSQLYEVMSMPTTIVIDKNGKIAAKHIGALDEEGFYSLLQ
ncbi:thiol-disulfide isomerase/thioredoxin [Bacillus pakistanensis]|uniref:Thiol-disulfide isomerase/thioredoxin n=1 Tax=Rossellomorea pakistanensis TaxID=992288 RepID=A0ABS2N7R4_9BACI|nr:TlpA disulfide reductase family protein [Bacillus pakistanensis]MBM7583891.1 thiol-disulfide isomerase/thioredoxin [Bacillus pakistanensis]